MWFNLYLITTLVSGIINVSKSMYIKRKMEYKDDEVIRKFNKLSTEAKIMSNIKNIFITLCPVVNIIHSIKNIKTSNDSLYSKWKNNTLNSYIYLDRKLDDNKSESKSEVIDPNEYVIEPEKKEVKENKLVKKVAKAQSNPMLSPLDYLRSEYNKEKRVYDMMVMNNASKEEIRQQVLKVNAIVEKYKETKGKSEKVSGPKLTLK